MKHYVGDFETTTHEKDKTRVWAFGIAEIDDPEKFIWGKTIDEFFDWCKKDNKLIYFHNLKFDGAFLIYWLLTHDFKYSDDKKPMTFNALISNKGQFYQIEVIYDKKKKRYKKVIFQDSYKKLPFKVEVIADAFKLPFSKLDLDYKKERPEGYMPTDEEIKYLHHDVKIVASALKIQYEQGLERMTIGADALANYKDLFGRKMFEYTFPVMAYDVDQDIRLAYKGGWTYLNGKEGREVQGGQVYDVNSLYPWAMYNQPLPYGMPVPFEGKYQDDIRFPLYVQKMQVYFKLKEGYLPTIQDKHSGWHRQTEYLKDHTPVMGEPLPIVLTSVDVELFFEHYDVTVVEYEGGYKFRKCSGVFKEYIDYWMHIKETNTGAMRTLAKLMLNNLYGKFATNPDITGKYPVIEDNRIKYIEKDPEFRDPVYIPMGAFITAWARYKTITTAQSVYDRFVYADTDSIHLVGNEVPDIDIHPSKLGAWKHEGEFTRARFIRAKTYIEEIDGKLHVTCAGMPDTVKQKVTWENFVPGFTESGKLLPKNVEGGVILQDSYFTIKRNVV